MKNPKNKSSYKLTIIAAAFLVIANIIVLAGVAYNRSGEPIASLKLTERELALPYRSRSNTENSGLALRLKWNVLSSNAFDGDYRRYNQESHRIPTWLTQDKMKALGIDVERIKADKENRNYGFVKLNTTEVIIVLEYDGDTYQSIVKAAEKDIQHYRNAVTVNPYDIDFKKRLERVEKSLKELKTSDSRLIAIDAGLNLQTLKQKYNDSSKYLMLRGEVYPYWRGQTLMAKVKQIFNDKVHIPLPYSKKIKEITGNDVVSKRYSSKGLEPRFEVELRVVKRLEVWVGGVGLL